MKILGYSERGIINSLIFSIVEDKDKGLGLMSQFIELIDIPEIKKLDKPKDYTILLEQSFSRFGDADLVIIMHYEKPKQNKILFIEGKVKTYQRKHWSLEKQFENFNKKEKYDGYSSNLFFQLSLKKLLVDYCAKYEGQKDEKGIEEPKFGDFRKIGKNGIVKKAFEMIKDSQAFYIGLIPSTKKEIDDFEKDNDTELHFLAWKRVHSFCDTNKLEKVIEIFDYNDEQIYNPNF